MLAALRDARLSAGCVPSRFREHATTALTSVRLPLDDSLFRNLSGEVDLISELARPWSLRIASMVTGTPGEELNALASDIFLSAQHPFDAELRLWSEQSTIALADRFEGPLQSFWVQAFVALSQSLPAFLGNAWLALLQQPVAITSLSRAVEELLRYAGPSVAQFRTAREDVRLGDATIRKGDRVALMLADANHDPEIFPNPDQLNLQRHPNPHVAFGAGDHTCIGAALVRRAASAAIASFSARCGTAQLLDYSYSEGFAIRSVNSLRVRLVS